MPVRSVLVRRSSAASISASFRAGRSFADGGAGFDAEIAQKIRLIERAQGACAHAFGGRANAWKSTCAVRSTAPGACSGSAKEWRADGLQRVAECALGMAVVDHQRGAL